MVQCLIAYAQTLVYLLTTRSSIHYYISAGLSFNYIYCRSDTLRTIHKNVDVLTNKSAAVRVFAALPYSRNQKFNQHPTSFRCSSFLNKRENNKRFGSYNTSDVFTLTTLSARTTFSGKNILQKSRRLSQGLKITWRQAQSTAPVILSLTEYESSY
jgi:hypothetical protein